MLVSNLLLLVSSATVALSASWIVPGAIWNDTTGAKIDAHGGEILKVGSTFYWIGQNVAENVRPIIYSSPDLLTWTNHGLQLSQGFMYRPKLITSGGKYIIVGSVNREVEFFGSNTILGGYASTGPQVALPPSSYGYTDQGVFQDTNGTWYFLASADHNNLQVNRINIDAKLVATIGERVSEVSGPFESPGMFKANDTYFLIASNKTGYRSNPNKVFTSTSISGPWSAPADIAPEANNTYSSQNTFELVITGTNQTTYIFMGDAWDAKGTAASNYMWAPMSVNSSARTATIDYHPMWKVDVITGIVSTPAMGKRYEAEHASLTGRAAITRCSHCVSKRSVKGIDRLSQVRFQNVTGTGSPQWISFHYTVNKPTSGEAHIYLNDDVVATNISQHNSFAGYHKTVPISLTLKPGDVNKITVGCSGSKDFSVHLDCIEVHDS